MRVWMLSVLLLAGCPTEPEDTDTDTDSDSDTDTDTDTEAEPIEITVATDLIELRPDATSRVPFSLSEYAEVDVDVAPTVPGCASGQILGLDEGSPEILVRGGMAYLGECGLTLTASRASGQEDSAEIPLLIEPDWEGTILQLGADAASWAGAVAVGEDGHIHLVGGEESEDSAALVVEHFDANGELVEAENDGGAANAFFVQDAERIDGTTWTGVWTNLDTSELLGVTSDGVGTPIDSGIGATSWPTDVDAGDDGVWFGGGVDKEARGAWVAKVSGGAVTTSSTWFPPEGERVLVYGAPRRPDGGFLLFGLAYDTPFPEEQGEDDWGSFVMWTDDALVKEQVIGLGVGNSQVRDAIPLPDGGALLGGYVRGEDLDGSAGGVGEDAFVRRVDSSGTTVWTRHWATETDWRVEYLAVQGDTVGFAGRIEDEVWIGTLGLSDGEVSGDTTLAGANGYPAGIEGHGLGFVVAGSTSGELGRPVLGSSDRFLVRMGLDGTLK